MPRSTDRPGDVTDAPAFRAGFMSRPHSTFGPEVSADPPYESNSRLVERSRECFRKLVSARIRSNPKTSAACMKWSIRCRT